MRPIGRCLLRTGTLPAEWSSLNLTYLKLDRNSLQGMHSIFLLIYIYSCTVRVNSRALVAEYVTLSTAATGDRFTAISAR